MTPAVMAFVAALKLGGRVLDVGSYDVNGSPRGLVADYTGVDARPGPNVDIVAEGAALPFPDHTFDAVLCLETLEHDRAPWRTVPELARVTKPGGLVVLTAPGPRFRPGDAHEYPRDYWRMTAAGLEALCAGLGSVHTFDDDDHAYAILVTAAGARFTPSPIVADAKAAESTV